jgi:isoaspartyl peptidase/L-asparaginase-like protein (Ntn-hydrolase superfamily)
MKVLNENNRKIRFTGLNLFESCQKIVNMQGGIVVDQRGLIAFWCDHSKMVKSGYASNEHEKTMIKNWSLN